MYYENKFKTNKEQDLYKAVNDWENLRKGVDINYDQISRIASYMSEKHFEKNCLKYMDKDANICNGLTERRMWLKTNDVWYNAFDNAPQKKVRYIRRMRENGEKLNSAPRITRCLQYTE